MQAVLSPAMDRLAKAEREVLNARVPLLRLVVPDVFDSSEDIRIDVTFSQEGLSKADYFWNHILARSSATFDNIILLTSWARTVRLVRFHARYFWCSAGR